jgi:hypothetical protein
MKTVLGYVAMVILAFVLAATLGLVLVEEIHKVFPLIANKLNDTQQGA